MKRTGWIVILVILIAAASVYMLKQTVKKHSKAYELALSMKKDGLPVDGIRVDRSEFMYEEIMATGKDFMIKISVYGNGLFMQNIVNNLENDRKDKVKTGGAPIYAAGDFIVVVYKEPANGLIKGYLEKKFRQVAEY
jgi:hypothetical protein